MKCENRSVVEEVRYQWEVGGDGGAASVHNFWQVEARCSFAKRAKCKQTIEHVM